LVKEFAERRILCSANNSLQSFLQNIPVFIELPCNLNVCQEGVHLPRKELTAAKRGSFQMFS